MDVRSLWKEGHTIRAICRLTGLSRNTVRGVRLLVHKSRSRTRTPRPRVVCLFSRSVDGAAAVAASAARSWGPRHEARRVAFVLVGTKTLDPSAENEA